VVGGRGVVHRTSGREVARVDIRAGSAVMTAGHLPQRPISTCKSSHAYISTYSAVIGEFIAHAGPGSRIVGAASKTASGSDHTVAGTGHGARTHASVGGAHGMMTTASHTNVRVRASGVSSVVLERL
jgi:hypothetical protein